MNSIPFGNWIISSTDFGDVCPVFKKDFETNKKIKKADLCVTALGLYEVYINGSRVGNQVFTPGWTSYQKRLQYQRYDVTELLQDINELVILAGKGWCVGELAWNGNHGIWNDVISVIAVLHIQYTDDTRESIVTDKDWQVAKSPVLYSELYHGETYDSNVTEFDWQPAALYEHDKSSLIEQEGEPIVEQDRLHAVELIQTPKGETVIDFGQNLTGYVEVKLKAPKGARAKIYHAEVLDKDGNFYTENLRTAKQQVTIICNGEEMTYKPHFSFQGFRYIRLEDWPEEVDLQNFTAVVVHSKLKRTGHFECSEPLVNQLYQNIIWGQKGNFLDVPTDCPQRNERLGWTGDAQVFVRAASYNFDVNRFFTKWLHDLKADQFEDGGVPAVIPNVLGKEGANSAAWGDAAVICPWQLYLSYGNQTILEQQFESMKNWIEYIRAQGENEFLWNTGEHYADWLGLDGQAGSCKGATDEGLIATAYFAYSTSLFIKAGTALQRDMSSYERLYQNIVKAFRETYIKDGKMTSQTQTAHVLALYFDLCENRAAIAKDLVELIHQNKDKLTTGFVGTPYLLHVLSDNGYAELAYTLLLQQEFPSWLYSVKMGATTIWEHWDGIRPDGSMWSADMNSFNHYAYGAVADWMYGVMAGIKPGKPGYEHIIIQPITDKRLSYVKASLDVKYGTIVSSWRRENGKTVYSVEIPENCTAEIKLGNQTYEVHGGKHSYRI